MSRRSIGLRQAAAAYDLVVIGAGPAGMAATVAAAGRGLTILVVDRDGAEGGQIHRGIATVSPRRAEVLGAAYAAGAEAAAAFRAAAIDHLAAAEVWYLDGTPLVGVKTEEGARLIAARHVIIATGAIERPMPIPGWTLPGMMTAGAGQILLKSAGLLPRGRTILAGTGPLLWLLAAQYLRAGRAPALIVDTTPRRNLLGALAHLPAFLASPLFVEGMKLVATVRRHVAVVGGAGDLAIEESGGLRRLGFVAGGRRRSEPFDRLFLHQGVLPEIGLARAAGLALRWNPVRAAFEPVVDSFGVSSVATISIAGDGAGIDGADAARPAGTLAALEACHRLGVLDGDARDRLAEPVRAALRRALGGRRFVDLLWRPAPEARRGRPGAILCRCEEVTTDDLAGVLTETGASAADQVKAFTRCGMGACRGRLCGTAVAETVAALTGTAVETVGLPRLRPPVRDVTLGDLAALASADPATAIGRDTK